jgi:hypothetical protein
MIYRFKILNFLLANFAALILTLLLIFSQIALLKSPIQLSGSIIYDIIQIGLTFSPLILSVILIPNYILGIQYLRQSKGIELKLDNDILQINRNNTNYSLSVNKSEILKVVHVNSAIRNSPAFSGFSYLVIFTNKNIQLIIPCFVISKDNFLKQLGSFENFIESYPVIPSIKPKHYLNAVKIPEFNLRDLSENPVQISGQYLGLIKYLIISALVVYTFFSYFFGVYWFFISIGVTLFVSIFLLLQNKVCISSSKITFKNIFGEHHYALTEIGSIVEIKETRTITLGLCNPIIKLIVKSSDGFSKKYFFFPRNNAYKALKDRFDLNQ